MKRSEALEKIAKYFYGIFPEGDPYWDSAKLKSETMLNFFENELGMEPPLNVSKSQEHQTQVNMWEPEDENNPWRPYEKK